MNRKPRELQDRLLNKSKIQRSNVKVMNSKLKGQNAKSQLNPDLIGTKVLTFYLCF